MKSIIDYCYNKAKQLLDENRDKLELMKDALMEYETIDVEQINDIMAGRKPRPPADWSDTDSGSGSAPADSQDDARDGKSDGSRSDKPMGGPVSEH